MQDSVLTLEYSKTKTNWKIHECLKGTHPQCISSDPSKRNRMYCNTFGNGLWKIDDYGETWDNIGIDSISSKDITSVSVSHHNLMFTWIDDIFGYNLLQRNIHDR
jgi:hypothetical protein